MILFLVFLSLLIGLNIRVSLILGILELLALLIFAFIRVNKKAALLSLIVSLFGVGLSFVRFDFNKETYHSIVVESKQNYIIVNSAFEKLYVYQKDNTYEIGDILVISGNKKKLDFEVLESSFDFKEYLNKHGVFYELNPQKIEVKFSTPFKIQKVKREFLNSFNSSSKALIGSILFSMGSEEEIYNSGKELHLFRLLSNSGIYLSLIYSIFSTILSYIVKKDKAKKLILITLFIPFLIFSYPRFVIIKFVFLKLLRWINEFVLKKRFNYLEIISLSCTILLLINYYYAYQDSFILAYFIPLISLFFNGSFRKIKRFKKKIFISLLILLSFIPFAASYYHEIAILSPLFQIILTPFLTLYYLFSLLAFIKIPIYSFINNYTYFIGEAFTFLNKINFTIYISEFHDYGIVLYELLYIGVIYFLSIRHKPLFRITSLITLFAFSIYIIPYKSIFADSVSFINVGQGDATLIRRRDTAVLIDTGGSTYKDIASEVLIPYFKKNQIYDIDLLITTHDDFDHSGAVSSLMKNFTIRRYITSYNKFPISISGFTFTNYNIYPDLWKEENDESLVIGFKTKKYNYLIMGDAPTKIERKIIRDNKNIPCDILKVGHHGSKTSSSEEFIKFLKPKIGIISCGKNNKYGHPHYVVLNILRKYKVTIRRTDLEGTITYWQ